jgi:hypothetical protein
VVEDPHCNSQDVTSTGVIGQVTACWQNIVSKLHKALSPSVISILSALNAGAPPAGASPAALRDACCRFRQFLLDLLANNDFNVHCTLTVPPCPPLPQEQPANNLAGVAVGNAAYNATVVAAVQEMYKILWQLILDCLCLALLPRCSPDPCDNRLILACVTVRNGKIERICNFACRQYAGSFPSLYYWLSAVPIFAKIARELQRLCCEGAVLDIVDPNHAFQNAIFAGDFALPQVFLANVNALLGKFSLESVFNLAKPNAISLPTLLGANIEQAAATLRQAGVQFAERAVESAAAVPDTQTGNLLAGTGDHIVMYRAGQNVVGFGRYDLGQEVADLRARVDALSAGRRKG